jgi:hypothetical protein
MHVANVFIHQRIELGLEWGNSGKKLWRILAQLLAPTLDKCALGFSSSFHRQSKM